VQSTVVAFPAVRWVAHRGEPAQQRRQPGALELVAAGAVPQHHGVGVLDLAYEHVGHAAVVTVRAANRRGPRYRLGTRSG
jgi:hypothetical protein